MLLGLRQGLVQLRDIVPNTCAQPGPVKSTPCLGREHSAILYFNHAHSTYLGMPDAENIMLCVSSLGGTMYALKFSGRAAIPLEHDFRRVFYVPRYSSTMRTAIVRLRRTSPRGPANYFGLAPKRKIFGRALQEDSRQWSTLTDWRGMAHAF